DDFTTNCTACGSSHISINVVPEENRGGAINVRLIVTIVSVIILISSATFLYLYFKPNPTVISNEEYDEVIGHTLLVSQFENNAFQLQILDEENKSIPPSEILRVRNLSKSTDMTYDRASGSFYPCLADLTRNATIEVTYNFNGERKVIITTHDITFPEGINPNSLAVCAFSLDPSEIIIKGVDMQKCTFEIGINSEFSSINESSDFLFSATGKNGPYQKSSVFDIERIRARNSGYDIWVIGKSDTVSYLRNGDRIPNCTKNKEVLASKIPEIKKTVEYFAQNPDKGIEFSKRLSKLDPPQINFYLNNQSVSLSSLINQMENLFFDDNAKFKVDLVEEKNRQVNIRIRKIN
ncbi:MAG: hypothetical protein JJU02_09435, partial [Cryomorphaceae bacterium]|nr:hypothetical protein [Cryomorphaceae bacterium]